VSARKSAARSEFGDQRGGPARRARRRLRDTRIRAKLSLILVVPVVTILGLGGLRLVDSGQRALDADVVQKLTSLSVEVSGLSHETHRERMVGAAYVADSKKGPEAYNLQAQKTDDVIARYQQKRQALGSVPEAITERLRRIDEHLSTLDAVRQEILARQSASVGQVMLRYGAILSDLVAYREEIVQIAGDSTLADSMRAVAAFSKAKAEASEEQAVAYSALKAGVFDNEQFSSFLATLTAQQEALVAFSLAASDAQRTLVDSTVTGDAVQLADRMAGELTRSAGGQALVTAEEVSGAVGAVTDLMRWTEERLDRDLLASATALRASVFRQVIIESVVVLVTLLLAVSFALMLARSMARSLGRLREGALAVAHRDLPAAVARLRDVQGIGENSPDEIARQVRDPIALTSRDEIGQVGQAFNVVHREAVRIAAEQAALRTSVSAMFLNLARRSQTLVDRMIGELDQIERGEEDPRRLAQLFQLDHLATRMRRNDENLLVLAGADSSPPRRDDALLVDALRAAQSEVELYDRIEFGTVDTDVSIASHAVNDVVRLLAELLDNATRFSPPNTVVVADARRIGDYVLVQIEDHGLGLSDEQMNILNQRLGGPSSVDVAAFRMMGLAVVARLASRYDIRIELRRNAEGGTVANVALPSSILVLPKIRGREPIMMTRPRTPLAVETAPAWSPRSWSPLPTQGENGRHHAPTSPEHDRPVAVGFHVSGAAASSAAAAAGMSMPTAGMNGPNGLVAGHDTNAPRFEPAGQPAYVGSGATPRAAAAADDTTELPIFREMEAAWFRTHGPIPTPAPDQWANPVAQASAPPALNPVSGVPVSGGAPSVYGHPTHGGGYSTATSTEAYVPRQREAHDWRTLADEGWQQAAAAAQPRNTGTTRSGLPKRVPMDQLVPGGVNDAAEPHKSRRTPEEVRGLLSAYHRGVQRGRASANDLSTIVDREGNQGGAR